MHRRLAFLLTFAAVASGCGPGVDPRLEQARGALFGGALFGGALFGGALFGDGLVLVQADSIPPGQRARAFRLYDELIAEGHAEAAHERGLLAFFVEKDRALAARYLRRAVALGHLDCYGMLSVIASLRAEDPLVGTLARLRVLREGAEAGHAASAEALREARATLRAEASGGNDEAISYLAALDSSAALGRPVISARP